VMNKLIEAPMLALRERLMRGSRTSATVSDLTLISAANVP